MRVKLEVDKRLLAYHVARLEDSQEFSNLSALYEAVAATDWAKSHPKPLTAPVVGLRIKEFGIQTKTKPGKRGRPLGFSPGNRGVRRKKNFSVEPLAKVTPSKYHSLVDRIAGGSKAAALKLMCLECSAYQVSEVKYCPVKTCPLWHLRPFQKNLVEVVDDTLEGE
jgi:hypothetical protein